MNKILHNSPKCLYRVLLGIGGFFACACTCKEIGSISEIEFADPPITYRPLPLWFWNNITVSADEVEEQLHHMVEHDGYGGCAILPFGPDFRPGYLGEEYMDIYGRAVTVADSLGAQMSLYDEYGFPSGSMGFSNADGVPRFQILHPDKTIKRLDKHEIPIGQGMTVELDLTEFAGQMMAVAAYDSVAMRSISLADCVRDSILLWTAPEEGGWRIMVFECVVDGKPRLDYLDSEAVALFIRDSHEKYNSRFKDRFGTVITSTFFDEPTMYYAQGRMWTGSFNEVFKEKYGMNPDSFYPALWYDVGARTAAVRNMMFGVHTSLYAEGFTGSVAKWAESHGIASTGHQDQEEIANTTCISGDLMLHGKYMTVPGIDKIGGNRPAELFYKVVSSSAYNWDKVEVMSETFGAMGDIPVSELYRIAIEQYCKGITNLIPHAVWYDDSNVTFPPELSWRNPLYSSELPQFNKFLSRLRYIFSRPARHVADIALLYPVQTQYAEHHLDGNLGPVNGGVAVDDTDYPEVSRLLTDELGRDFTYLHPEVLSERCEVKNGKLTMSNKVNWESFSVIVLPGVKTISLDNMKQVYKAWEHGVKVIFTTQLPCQSADYDVDNSVIEALVERMLCNSGGKKSAVFVAEPSLETLSKELQGCDTDVRFLSEGSPFNYIHKVFNGSEVFLIGNIDSDARSHMVSLRGEFSRIVLMDPHTGESSDAEICTDAGRTIIDLHLDPARSIILRAFQ